MGGSSRSLGRPGYLELAPSMLRLSDAVLSSAVNKVRALLSVDPVHVFQVSAQVSTLSECLVTCLTSVRALAGVLPKMVAKVATLLEHGVAISDTALEIQFLTLSKIVAHLNSLVPMSWDAFK